MIEKPPFRSMISNFVASAKNKMLVKTKKRLTRSQYKEVWNSISQTENDAKIHVSGYTDEELYLRTGQSTVEMLKSCVGIRKEDVVLEIGAGVGRVGALVAPLCQKWIGTDVSENMIKHIHRRLSGLPNIEAIVTNGFNLAPVSAESVDLVYCTVVFMHLEEWERYGYVEEGFRILRPGGRILVDNVNLVSGGGWKFFEEHRGIPPRERPAQISKTSTPQELETYLRRAGFIEIRQRDISDHWIVTFGIKPLEPTLSRQADTDPTS